MLLYLFLQSGRNEMGSIVPFVIDFYNYSSYVLIDVETLLEGQQT
jgi:hypothetical protein